ncbi:MAG: hypothetical protein A3H96_00470 [Acidobacteria bacterium RIFCSPLOWO2_02_FULL_67_36]|nr:MAG: hypothetical protein A3H96_00470 [Acidobacteria bacterium RIFCSPLOWO2_02_FULL_67_36]OFW23150.1 MAG: hypothetical protein A3G21_00880 [Acidobacteria bacterium RIFCSPLOWO2_12_FULL_66_21]
MRIGRYIAGGRKPWAIGYAEYKNRALRRILRDESLLDRFRRRAALPDGYGSRLDERLVEYPWLVARLGVAAGRLLDAGSTLNDREVLALPALRARSVVISNLTEEPVILGEHVSYVRGDLRLASFRDGCFDEVACISVLEHIGMNNTFIYSPDSRRNESRPQDYVKAVRELKRVLKPRGRLLLTVPYGRYENHEWLQQFDRDHIRAVCDTFDGTACNVDYYKYAGSWQIADESACTESRYFDIHRRGALEPDYVAAARAVACVELVH